MTKRTAFWALGSVSVLPTYPQIHQVAYIHQILEETLRLWPTEPGGSRGSRGKAPSSIGASTGWKKGTSATILIAMLHRDKQVWGENPEKFDPDRSAPRTGPGSRRTPTSPLALGSAPVSGGNSPCRRLSWF